MARAARVRSTCSSDRRRGWAQQAYIKASNTDAFDSFGHSIALSSDGSTLAVGAVGEDSSATGINGDQADNSANSAGAVYVFRRSGTTWTQQAYIKASNTDPNDSFGWAVALSSDGSTLAVGALGEDSSATGVGGNQADNTGGPQAGAAYVFVRSGVTWTQQAYIKASNTEARDSFGHALALSADGSTMAVGAWGEDSSATGIGGNQADNAAATAGAVYVFVRSGVTWTQQAYVKSSNTDAGDSFGMFGLSLSADGSTLAVGATGEDSNATGVGGNQADNSASASGAVYVFRRIGTTWTQQAYIKAPNTDAGDIFGVSVALSGDGAMLAIGATGEDSSARGIGGDQASNTLSSAGAAYVFSLSGSTWSLQAYIKASNPDASDAFGPALALSADGSTLAVGAGSEDSSATGIGGDESDNSAMSAGAAYVF
ncbi:MAG: FG-GAP repeat protein [Sandaracinaceae bacterium]|nr:FG-GAP repeat protein [Sandaracinaceae bacterium]